MRSGQLIRLLGGQFRHTIVSLDGNFDMADRLSDLDNISYVSSQAGAKSFLTGLVPVGRTLRDIRPNVLVSYNWGSAVWWIGNFLLARLPHIHIEDGFGPEERNSQHRRRILIRRWSLQNSLTHTVLPSRTLLRIASDIWRLPSQSLSYIPNGVDAGRFRASRSQSNSAVVTIGTVATLRPEKNIPRLIDLFGALNSPSAGLDLRLVIVGGGPEFDNLQAYAARSESADKITFTGPTMNPERYLRGFDIFAVTSDTEQMPLGVLEAMASGLAVVSFAVGDISAMVSEKNREFASIPPSDDRGFVNALAKLIHAPSLRHAIGQENVREISAQFTLESMKDRYSALFVRAAS